jgi:Protein of unknown function (DUF3277).
MTVYSLKDVHASISGPGGNFPLTGDEAGIADEGISTEPNGDQSGMQTGGDGAWMHSLYADKSGVVKIRLLKTSTINAQLQAMFNYQTSSAALHGRNTIIIRDTVRGDVITCRGVAFKKDSAKTYAKDAGLMEWTFDAGHISSILGNGSPEK